MSWPQLVSKTFQLHRNPVGDPFLGEILLQLVEIRTELLDLPVLGLSDAPDEQRDLHPVFRKSRGNRLADETSRQVTDLQTSLDRVIVREGDEIHPGSTESYMEFAGIGNAGRNAKTP